MNDSTLVESLAADQDGVIFDVESLYRCLMDLPDQRARRGYATRWRCCCWRCCWPSWPVKTNRRASPSGSSCARTSQAVLQLKRPLTPHAMTYRRVLANAARAAALDTLTRECLFSWPQAGQSVQIALDGKTLRGTLAPEQTRCLHLLAAYLPDWPDLQQVFKIDRCTVYLRTGVTQTETAYGVTSITAAQASPARLRQVNRRHWGNENGLHYRRDVTRQEDAGRTTATAFGHTLAALNNLVIGLMIGRGWRNLAKARQFYDARPDQALRLLFARPTATL